MNLKCHIYKKKRHIHRNYLRKNQFGGQQSQNSLLSNLIIEMIQINVATAEIKKFPIIQEAPALDIFFIIIYITIFKLLAAMLTIV